MATNFSPCKGSYVLNQFPSNVMFGMNGFHVSTSGAIQGHHGPLVLSVDADEDIHICGLCKTTFTDVELFLQHKKYNCPIRLARQREEVLNDRY